MAGAPGAGGAATRPGPRLLQKIGEEDDVGVGVADGGVDGFSVRGPGQAAGDDRGLVARSGQAVPAIGPPEPQLTLPKPRVRRYSTRMRKLLFPMILLLAVSAPADDKKQGPILLARPNQTVEIKGLKVPAPAQKCENFAWAAGVELMLRMQGVALDQKYWITKMEGGELCIAQLRPMEELANIVNGEYVLDVGHKVKLATKYTNGAPTVLDDLIVSIREGSPFLFVWKGHPYVVYGMTYDEFIAQNNARIFMVKEIKLIDPLAAADDPQRLVSFVRGRDNLDDVNGTMIVRAVPVQ